METTIYLIRHAQMHPSPSIHYSEWPLSTVGQGQAEKLCGLLEPLGIEVMFSSPFLRCLQTVQSFADKAGIDINVKDDLRERLVVQGIVDGFSKIWRRSWDDFNFAMPGCESSLDAQKRFAAAVEDILAGNKRETIGISAHGNVIGLFLNHIHPAFRRDEAEALTNPDVVRVLADGRFVWDQEFHLPGLENIATNHLETPFAGRVSREPGNQD